MIDGKKIDILCGLIASPHQRIVHQLPDKYMPKGCFFPRHSHTTVRFNGIKRATVGLMKAGYLSVDRARSDDSQIEYRCSAAGRRFICENHMERLSVHRDVSKKARRNLKKARALLPKKASLRDGDPTP